MGRMFFARLEQIIKFLFFQYELKWVLQISQCESAAVTVHFNFLEMQRC